MLMNLKNRTLSTEVDYYQEILYIRKGTNFSPTCHLFKGFNHVQKQNETEI